MHRELYTRGRQTWEFERINMSVVGEGVVLAEPNCRDLFVERSLCSFLLFVHIILYTVSSVLL